MAHFYEWILTVSRLQIHYEETVYFLSLGPQELLVLIWSTLEGWKAKSILEPSSGFEPETPGLGIQTPAHWEGLNLIFRFSKSPETVHLNAKYVLYFYVTYLVWDQEPASFGFLQL